jgi:diguanylate cyclase (GGDEF)-like protein/PAS domain S-box-containing protein
MTMVAPSHVFLREHAVSRPIQAAPYDDGGMLRGLEVLRAHDTTPLAFLQEVSLDGLWMLDLETADRGWMSPRIWKRLGYDPPEGAGEAAGWAMLLHPETDRAAGERFSAYCAAPDGVLDEVMRFRHRDGSSVWLRCRGIALRDADGRAVRLLGAHTDITEQKRVEEEALCGKAELTRLLAKSAEANARLEDLVNVDSLTQLANRRRFDEALVQEWRRAARDQSSLSLVMVDIDRFKGFNDRYGHLAGDDCLRRVAAAVAEGGRRSADLAARYGGEEMVLLLPSTTAAGAEKVARECRSAVEALAIRHEGNMSCGGVVTASFGVATATPAEHADLPSWTELIAEADRQLYEAKRTGRNKVMTPAIAAFAGAFPVAPDEEARLLALSRYEAAGAAQRTQEMDGIARLAATLTGAPIALVSLITRDEKRFLGNFNLPGQDRLPREISLCTHTILGDEPMVVADATHDVRFKENPLVTGEFGLRYYAGAPIVSQSTGHKLGTLCIVDTVPHERTGVAERAVLSDLAGMVSALLEDNLKLAEA